MRSGDRTWAGGRMAGHRPSDLAMDEEGRSRMCRPRATASSPEVAGRSRRPGRRNASVRLRLSNRRGADSRSPWTPRSRPRGARAWRVQTPPTSRPIRDRLSRMFTGLARLCDSNHSCSRTKIRTVRRDPTVLLTPGQRQTDDSQCAPTPRRASSMTTVRRPCVALPEVRRGQTILAPSPTNHLLLDHSVRRLRGLQTARWQLQMPPRWRPTANRRKSRLRGQRSRASKEDCPQRRLTTSVRDHPLRLRPKPRGSESRRVSARSA